MVTLPSGQGLPKNYLRKASPPSQHSTNRTITLPDHSTPSTRHAILLVNKAVAQEAFQDSTWFSMDGTFRITPRQGRVLNIRSSQVFNILADYHGHAVVVFTVIMTSRRRALYDKVFALIRSTYPNFKPAQMMADYELGMRKAFKEKYPSSKLYGCR